MLHQSLRFPHISTGDMLREHVRNGDAIGIQVRDLLKAGQLVPDELVNRMVTDRIERLDCEAGFILDGYPRTIHQVELLFAMLAAHAVTPHAIHLRVDQEKLVNRLTNRRQCPQCGTLYNLLLKKPILPGRCDIEGARLVAREDDREEVIRQRFEAYEKQTAPVLAYLASLGRFHEIEASESSPEEIFRELTRVLTNGAAA